MTERIPENEQTNYEVFRECVAEPVLKALAEPEEKPKRSRDKKKETRARRHGKNHLYENEKAKQNGQREDEPLGNGNDAEDLGDFIDYLSTDLFTSIPPALRRLTPTAFNETPSLQNAYTLPLPAKTATHLLATLSPTALQTLESYALLPSHCDSLSLSSFFLPIFTSYITSTTTVPQIPIWSTTRTSACELCQREWIPLTYHHLIPRSTHVKVLKRGWHEERKLGSVAWLCRACHSFVHRVATNEELARWWWSVELLEEREDVRKWVDWVGRVRWKAR
ncbi:hypothetical protein K504DRAFT_384555 [Pleomassaria siparia CBS 279.74]|uniref:HNH domain-containing protein n=1 Tax=Pleomassaria siparia CBS 279.74 TaxID=1314801 RepID=A0A6G1K4A4_9PLEO|nr:hypothetical protein K504DRAFT_384555 [Pleomassaria siparia CBS 279.74]